MNTKQPEEILEHAIQHIGTERLSSLEEIAPVSYAAHIMRGCQAQIELERCGSRCICGTTPVELGAEGCPVHGYR